MLPRVSLLPRTKRKMAKVSGILADKLRRRVKLDSATQTALAKKELQELFTWLDFLPPSSRVFYVDRAEPLQADGKRPDGVYMKELGNIIIAWPTKLALAPKLANEIISCLNGGDARNGTFDARALRTFPMPGLAAAVWDELLC